MMKDNPHLLCLRVYSDLERKEYFSLLYSNVAFVMGWENGETRSVLESMTVTLLEITKKMAAQLDIVPVSGVMVPSRGRWKRPFTQRSRLK
jgi:hypothetical protein